MKMCCFNQAHLLASFCFFCFMVPEGDSFGSFFQKQSSLTPPATTTVSFSEARTIKPNLHQKNLLCINARPSGDEGTTEASAITDFLSTGLNNANDEEAEQNLLPPPDEVLWGDSTEDIASAVNQYEAPGFRELLAFIVPAVAMIQAPAIMSMVDTAVVGRASSLGLAALSPATQMCDAATYVCGFLGLLTSNRVATAAARGDNQELEKTVSECFAYAIGLGLFIILVIQTFGKSYMTLVVGQGAMEVIPLAVQFSRIRILGAVAIMLTYTGQAISLGLKDSVTPLKVIIINSVLNLFGDIFLVNKLGMGIQGAAIATAASEMVGAAFMIRAIKKKFHGSGQRLFNWPNFEETKKFLRAGLPLSFMLWTRAASFAFLASTVALAGTTALGAYQVVLRVTWFLTSIPDGISLAAQTYLPRFHLGAAEDAGASGARARAGRRALLARLGALAAAAAAAMGAGGGALLLGGHGLFTGDPAVVAEIHKTVPTWLGILATYAAALSLEGALLALRDGAHLARVYAALLLLKVGYLEVLKRFFQNQIPAGNFAVLSWGGLMMYNFGRASAFAARLWMKLNHDDKERKVSAMVTTICKDDEQRLLFEEESNGDEKIIKKRQQPSQLHSTPSSSSEDQQQSKRLEQ